MKRICTKWKAALFCLLFAIPLLLADGLAAQQRQLTGRVVDQDGDPVVGAYIEVVGTSVGSVSGPTGTFTINVPANSSISVSFIGYIAQTVAIGDRTSVEITLEPDMVRVDDVVVIGYGVQRKSDVTGAVSQVRAEDLENRSVSTVGEALMGKTAGVNVLMTSGAPGDGPSIRVRGYSSNSSSDPLYIVDGLKVENINYLDPENIASLEVLKDAASAAIYGAQAGNGVVLITTKTGSKNTTGRVFYNMQYTTSKISNIPEVMNAREFSEYMLEGNYTSQEIMDTAWYTYKNGSKADTYWPDHVFEKGALVRNTVGFEGGNDRGSLYVALSAINNNGVVVGKDDVYRRLTSQVNADYQVKPWLKVGLSNSIENFRAKNIRANSEVNGLVSTAILYDPVTPYLYEMDNLPSNIAALYNEGRPIITDDNGAIYGISTFATSQIWHPQQMIRSRSTKSNGVNTNGTFYADFTPIKNFVFTSRFGYRYSHNNSSTYVSPYYINSMNLSSNGTLTGRNSNALFYQWENFANYNFSLGKNNFTAMAGMSYQKSSNDFINVSTDLLTNEAENYRYISYSSASANDVVTGFPNEVVSMAYFGRLSWSYDNRYNLQVNFRADAFDTSKLSKQSRWGYFPSLSAGWTISNEAFMKDMSRRALSFLRLRASWGKNGNVNVLSDYVYNSTLTSNTYYNFTNTSGTIFGIAPSTVLPNPELKWEQSVQVDAGLDARFLNDRLTLTYDFYRKTTEGLLTTTTPAATTGGTSVYVNAGNVRNFGHEFELSWRERKNEFSYGISANLATINNKVVKGPSSSRLNGATVHPSTTITYFEEGYPVWYFRTYRVDHINPETGATVYKKADGTPTESPTDDDRVYTGSGIPDFNYGLTINMAYKGFDLTIFGSGQHGGKLLQAYYRTDLPTTNRLRYLYTDRWTTSNTGASVPKPNVSDTRYWVSDAMLSSASYFKIRQIQLGYTIPKQYLRAVHISSLRVYASLDNFFTFTRYKGMDPETRSNATNGIGIDRLSFPTSKNIVFGLNLSF